MKDEIYQSVSWRDELFDRVDAIPESELLREILKQLIDIELKLGDIQSDIPSRCD